MISASDLDELAVFMPELKPLIPGIMAALQTGTKVKALTVPAQKRIEAGLPALWEAAEEIPQLQKMLPEFIAAFKTGEDLEVVIEVYKTRLAAARK